MKIIEYIKSIHSAMSDVSSKRIYGGIIVLTALVMICIYRHDVLYETLLAGCGLLGLGIFDRIKK
jgi:hypothetical protein